MSSEEVSTELLVSLPDEQVVSLVCAGKLAVHSLESKLGDCERAVRIRRAWLERDLGNTTEALSGLPVANFDYICQRLAAESRCLVVSVEYRLAPEHPFPHGIEDCCTAMRYIAKAAGDWGGNPQKIGVAGDSAGGNLSAVLAVIARNGKAGLPKLKLQLLLFPIVDWHRDDYAS